MRRTLLLLGLCVLAGCGGGKTLPAAAHVSTDASSVSLPASSAAPAPPVPQPKAPPVAVAPPPPGRVAIVFPDAQDGWVAGAGVILNTSDSGRTWTVQHRGPETFVGLDFPTRTEGWALTADGPLHTLDGGHTWAPVPSAAGHLIAMEAPWAVTASGSLWQVGSASPWQVSVPGHVSAVHFADATHGWAAGDGRLYGTSDGGLHWTEQLDATRGTVAEFADGPAMLTFPTAQSGWVLFVAGSGHTSQKSYALYRTDDRGARWVQALANRFFSNTEQGSTPIGPGGYPLALAAPDPADAYLVFFAPAPNAVIVDATHDGGRTWSNNVGQPALVGTYPDVAAMFTDARRGWLATRADGHLTLWSTQDGGATWTWQYAIGA